MSVAWVQTELGQNALAIDPAIGNIRALRLGGIAPLHTAPWADSDAPGVADMPPVERHLAGDFLCAPFAGNDVEGGPPHGWSANSPWRVTGQAPGQIAMTLERAIMGATVHKTATLSPDAPILYQVHVIEGGAGQLPVAHHPMIRMAGRATLSVSPKRAALTPDAPLEPGRNRLESGQRFTDLTRCPTAEGDTLDLTALPIAERHEDFVALVEAPGATLGWTAVLREEEDDIVFFLKDPAMLPVTMLWHSNGGRDAAPWNGDHRGVLGIEDGCAAGALPHSAAILPNRVADEGVPTALTLGARHRIAQVIGAVPRPAGWRRIADIAAQAGTLTLTEAGGQTLTLPFDTEFFRKTDQNGNR